jgi:hypothetical protein
MDIDTEMDEAFAQIIKNIAEIHGLRIIEEKQRGKRKGDSK